MTMQNNTIKTFITLGAAFAFVFGVVMATPAQAHAFSLGQIIDPGCFFACSSGGGGHTTKNVTNYYNGNYQSPGGTVVNGSVTYSNPAPAPAYNNYNYTTSAPAPTYAYNYNTAPIYTYGSSYSYNQPVYTQPVYVQQPAPVVYQQQPVYTYPLYVSCSPSSTYGVVGSPVTWTANVSGGAGFYTYAWSGTDGLYGSNETAYFSYSYPGFKTATVTVYSNGQSMTQSCSDGVSVSGAYYQQVSQPVYAQPVYSQPVSSNYNGLDVGCYADPTTAGINQPVTWSAEVTGGAAPYTYSWTGSNDISGTAATVIKYYQTSGSKNAIVTVTSADGRTATHACSNTVTVRSNAAPSVRQPVQQAPAPQANNGNPLSAASLFSLSNIPWGWVTVLIILVLFATVIYLMFNKPKM